jgi:hypothetical protein
MRFPTWPRLAQLLERYCHGAALVDAFYVPQPPRTVAPCGERQRLCSLTGTDLKGVGPPGVKNKWIYVR